MPLMKLQSFRGQSIEEAQEKAAIVLGPVIDVHFTRTVRRRGLLGLLGASDIEIGASQRKSPETTAPANPYESRRELLSRLDDATDSVRNIFDGVYALTRIYCYLIKCGFSAQLGQGLLLSLKNAVPPHRMRDFAFVKESFRQYLKRMIKVACGIDPFCEHNVAVMLGPTGSGKTTTIAKLAARMSIDYRLKVALVTTDTFRVGAVDQIGIYAEALGIPLKVAGDARELVFAVSEFAEYNVVLVDTAGIGGTGAEKGFIDGMRTAMLRAGQCSTYLLVDMRAHPANHIEILKKFSPLRIDNLILTKTDECAVHGHVLDLLVYAGIPVTYITNGQNVPGDLRKATADGLADLLLGDGFHDL